MKTIQFLLVTLLSAAIQFTVSAQGCIAVRPMASASSFAQFRQNQHSKMLLTLNYRNLHSYKHFVGTEEQKQRVIEGTNVINDQNSVDLGLLYQFTNRFSVSVNLPFSVNDRSSLYEHYGNDIKTNPKQLRFHTGSKGIGDARITANYWLFNPAKHLKQNLMVGLGVKLPTGNYNVQDQFHKRAADGSDYTITKVVDQSIQLGDGGLGVNVELQGYTQLRPSTTLFYNGFYLFSPKEINAAPLSVPDQFAARIGVNQNVKFIPGLSVLLGGRIEGIPAYDAIGGSQGSRRPGYIVSVEPGLSYVRHQYAFSATVPVAVVRNRIRSYADIQDPAGLKHGDAAFADYFVSLTVSRWF